MAKDIQIYDESANIHAENKKSEAELMLMGESYILGECQKLAGYSYIMLSNCVECLLSLKMVSAKGILRWIFGSENDGFNKEIVSNSWWNFASLAIRISSEDIFGESNSVGLNGMIIDEFRDDEEGISNTPSFLRKRKITDFVTSLLQYASERIASLLQELRGDNKFSHYEADLKEGLKFLVQSTKTHVTMVLQKDDIVTSTNEMGGVSLDIETWVSQCAFDDVLSTIIQ
jgi:hypothetical protein